MYLVNLSEKDYVRKKNKWLPKIKQWIDSNNPGDPLIPFSVSFEERLAPMSDEDKKAEEEKVGAVSALPKITHAGYACLEVCTHSSSMTPTRLVLKFMYSSFGISPAVPTKYAHGPFEKGLKHLKQLVSSSMSQYPSCSVHFPNPGHIAPTLRINSCVAKLCHMKISKNMEVSLLPRLLERFANKGSPMKVSFFFKTLVSRQSHIFL